MTLTIRSILLLIAVLLFVLDGLGVAIGGLDTIALGLAFFAASFLAPDTAVGTGGRGIGMRGRDGDGVRDRDGDLDTRR
jgi:hypothetical protein